MSVSGGNGKAAIVNGQSSRHQVATGSAPATAAAAAATAAASPTSMVVDVPQPTAKVAAQARKQRAKAAFGAPAKLNDAVGVSCMSARVLSLVASTVMRGLKVRSGVLVIRANALVL